MTKEGPLRAEFSSVDEAIVWLEAYVEKHGHLPWRIVDGALELLDNTPGVVSEFVEKTWNGAGDAVCVTILATSNLVDCVGKVIVPMGDKIGMFVSRAAEVLSALPSQFVSDQVPAKMEASDNSSSVQGQPDNDTHGQMGNLEDWEIVEKATRVVKIHFSSSHGDGASSEVEEGQLGR
jgi:hypothetical protein